MYKFYKALHYIKENIKIYLFILFQVILSLSIVFLNLNSSWSANHYLLNYEQQLANQMVSINLYQSQENKRGQSEDDLYMPPELYWLMVETYGDACDIQFYLKTSIYYADTASQEVKVLTCLFMPNDTFYQLFQHKMEDQIAYVGVDCFSKEQKEHLSMTSWFDYYEDVLVVNAKKRPYKNLSDLTDTKYLYQGIAEISTIDLASTIIMPMEWIDDVIIQSDSRITSNLKCLSDTPGVYKIILEFLNQHTEDKHYYQLSYDYYRLKDSIRGLQIDIKAMNAVARFMLLISFVGIVGALLIFIENRKKHFAISIAYGASIRAVYLELFIEITIVLLAAAFLSIIIIALFANILSTAVYSVWFHYKTIPLIVLFILGISVCVTGVALFSTTKFMPAEILCGEN